MGRPIEPHDGNISDAALLEGAAATLRSISLNLDDEAKKARTVYAEEAFAEIADLIADAISTLTSAASQATENAVDDAAGELADELYDNRRDY